MHTFIEYRVRPVTRYVLTRFESMEDAEGKGCGGSVGLGEYQRADTAFHIGCALARDENKPSPIQGETKEVKFPEHPDHPNPNYGFEVRPFDVTRKTRPAQRSLNWLNRYMLGSSV